MNQLQMLKMALIAYVNSAKAVWSTLAYPLSIISKRIGKLKDYRIYGNTVQDGEPTPENPIEMQNVGDITTKNLIDSDLWLSYFNKLEDGSYKSKKLITTEERVEVNIPAGKYTLSMDIKCGTGENYRPCFYYADGTRKTAGFVSSTGEWIHHKVTMTFDSDVVSMGWYYSGSSNQLYFRSLQIEAGDTETEYEPCNKYKVGVVARGKNLYKPTRFSAGPIVNSGSSVSASNSFGTTLSTTDATQNELTVTQTKASSSGIAYQNGYFCIEIGQGVLAVGKKYNISFDCEILDSLLDVSNIAIMPNGTGTYAVAVVNGRVSVNFSYVLNNGRDNYIEIRNSGHSLKIKNIMITEAESNTDYEPYREPQTFNIFLDEPLRKIGKYKDYIDFENRKVIRNTGERVFNGTESWKFETLSGGTNCYMKVSDAKGDNLVSMYCNKGKYYNSGNLTNDFAIRISTSYNFNYRYPNVSDISTYKQMLADWYAEGNPLYINYVLNNTKEEAIDPPSLPQFKGATVYEVDTEIKPSGMEVCYYE